MKYLFMLYGPDRPEPGTPEAQEMFEAYSAATQAIAQAGVLIDCAPLQPVFASTTVRLRVLLTTPVGGLRLGGPRGRLDR
jgi:Uncharacterized protein conserved in bacteria